MLLQKNRQKLILFNQQIKKLEISTKWAPTISNNITSIDDGVFRNCKGLTTITIPNNITSIGKDAFSSCSSLESIVIPSSVISIGEEAFYNCSSLKIYCETKSKPSGWSSYWNSSNRPVYWGINETNFYEENGIQYVLNLETKEEKIRGKLIPLFC